MTDPSKSVWRELVFNEEIQNNDVMKVYETWHKTYDADLDEVGYPLCRVACQWVCDYFPEEQRPQIKVIDFAAGTGRMGKELYKAGFRILHATDGSQPMLDRLEELKLYQKSICALQGPGKKTPGIDDNSYDLATMTGGFAKGHMPIECMTEIARVLKPGGIFVHGMTEKYLHFATDIQGLEPLQQQMEQEGIWKQFRREVMPGLGANGNTGLYQAFKKN